MKNTSYNPLRSNLKKSIDQIYATFLYSVIGSTNGGLVVWIFGNPLWKGLLLIPLESQTHWAPNHQSTTSWWEKVAKTYMLVDSSLEEMEKQEKHSHLNTLDICVYKYIYMCVCACW